MARCEDFPCCGHEAGCCPDYDEGGRQLNMVCTCGAKLPLTSRFSICQSCLNRGEDGEYDGPDFDDRDFDDEPDVDELTEHEDFAHDNHLEDYGDWGYEGMHEE